MRYITWFLHWPTEESGYGPEEFIKKNGSTLEASGWVYPANSRGKILGYFQGDLEINSLEDWQVEELSAEDALLFAKMIDSNAYIDTDGTITSDTPRPL